MIVKLSRIFFLFGSIIIGLPFPKFYNDRVLKHKKETIILNIPYLLFSRPKVIST